LQAGDNEFDTVSVSLTGETDLEGFEKNDEVDEDLSDFEHEE
jgi:hypothetical protein